MQHGECEVRQMNPKVGSMTSFTKCSSEEPQSRIKLFSQEMTATRLFKGGIDEKNGQ